MSRRAGEPRNSCPVFDDALKQLGTASREPWGSRKWLIPSSFADSIAAHIASEWNDVAKEIESSIETARGINAELREWAHAEIATKDAEIEAKDAEIEARNETIRKLEARVAELEQTVDKLEDRLNEEP